MLAWIMSRTQADIDRVVAIWQDCLATVWTLECHTQNLPHDGANPCLFLVPYWL